MNIYPKEIKTLTQKDICTPLFIAAFIYNSEDTVSNLVSFDGWTGKEDVV